MTLWTRPRLKNTDSMGAGANPLHVPNAMTQYVVLCVCGVAFDALEQGAPRLQEHWKLAGWSDEPLESNQTGTAARPPSLFD